MNLYDEEKLQWCNESLWGLTKDQIEDKASSMIKRATGDKESILLSVVIIDIGIPYNIVHKLIEDGRINVIADKNEEDLEREKKIKERYNELIKELIKTKNQAEASKPNTKTTTSKKKSDGKEGENGMFYNR